MRYEMKRFFYGRDIFYFAVGGVFFIVLTAVNIYIVQPFYGGIHSKTIDYYNAVTQCMPFVFAPVIGVYFSKDLEKNATLFYKSYKISFKKYVWTKLSTCFILGSLVIFLESLGFIFFLEHSIIQATAIGLIILVDFLYFLLLCNILAIIFKKRTTTVFSIIGAAIVLSIINIIPIPVIEGHLYLLDGNSNLTANVMSFIEYGGNLFYILAQQLVWVFILIGLLFGFICRESKN